LDHSPTRKNRLADTFEGVGTLVCRQAHPWLFLMTLTFLTMIAGAALGGGLAVDLTAVVIAAAVALAVLAAANGARFMRRVAELFDE
jgi:hypothetical protein